MAGFYDSWAGVPTDTGETVEFLRAVAGPGSVLELGIGTGRVALPLVERGFDVHGIDASAAMLDMVRRKSGSCKIVTHRGDFSRLTELTEHRFGLIYVVFSTFFGLLTQSEQARCFLGIAQRLEPDGAFVLEAFVPDPDRFDRCQRTETVEVGDEHVMLVATRHDATQQRSWSQFIRITRTATEMYPIQIRYSWPSELDLMARAAGLSLKERWANWQREPFTAASERHVSVYRHDPSHA